MKQATAKISQLFSSLLPANWTNFTLHMFVPAKASEEYYLHYSTDGGLTWHDLMSECFADDEKLVEILDAQDAAKELHELCAFEDDCWSEMTYTLNHAGKFDCSFSYDKLDFVTMAQRKLWGDKTK